MGKDGLSNSVGDVVPNMSSPSQGPCPVLPRGDQDILLKVPHLFLFNGEMSAIGLACVNHVLQHAIYMISISNHYNFFSCIVEDGPISAAAAATTTTA